MIVVGNTPSCLDYHTTAAHSEFTASAASSPPPLCPSPPPSSARLGSTTSDRPALSHLTPTPSKLKSDSLPHAALLHPTAHDVDVESAAVHIPVIFISFRHHDQEQTRRDTHGQSCLSEDATATNGERYFDFGRPYGPCFPASWQPSACTALTAPQSSASDDPMDRVAPVAPLLSASGPYFPGYSSAFGFDRIYGPCGPCERYTALYAYHQGLSFPPRLPYTQ